MAERQRGEEGGRQGGWTGRGLAEVGRGGGGRWGGGKSGPGRAVGWGGGQSRGDKVPALPPCCQGEGNRVPTAVLWALSVLCFCLLSSSSRPVWEA